MKSAMSCSSSVRSIYLFERGAGGLVRVSEVFPRSFNSEQRRVRRLLRALILAGSFAERFGVAVTIQQIVGDLKKQAELSCILSYGG